MKSVLVVTIMLIAAMGMAGCLGSSPPPVAPQATVVYNPAPAGTPLPLNPTTSWPTLETPATGHPYSKTYSFQGTGDYDQLTFTTTSDATWVFRLTPPAQGGFIVILKNEQGQDIITLANEQISSAGTKSIFLKAGNYYFDVAASAPWYITMSTPS